MTDVDPKSFVAGIAAQYGSRLRRFLRLRSPAGSDVRDLAQEVYMRLLRVQNHREIRSAEAYLFTVASHVVQQDAQKRKAVPESVEISEVLAHLQLVAREDTVSRVETLQRIEQLERTLQSLPPSVARALLLHRFAGLSVQEIAEDLGVAEITVKKYLARALMHCRECGENG